MSEMVPSLILGTVSLADTETRYCRRGEHHRPVWMFVLADDPTARITHRGVLDWCGTCLIARNHIPAARLATAERAVRRADIARMRAEQLAEIARVGGTLPTPAPPAQSIVVDLGDRFPSVVLSAAQRARAFEKAREHAAVNALVDAADGDPTFARALRRAAAAVRAIDDAA